MSETSASATGCLLPPLDHPAGEAGGRHQAQVPGRSERHQHDAAVGEGGVALGLDPQDAAAPGARVRRYCPSAPLTV